MLSAQAMLILAIIDKVLAIALEVQQNMPEEARRAHWERHEKAMQFWSTLFERISGQA